MPDLDDLRARLGFGLAGSSDPKIEPLDAEAAQGLRLPWLSRFSPQSLAEHARQNPGLCYWAPASGEYIAAEQWRNRPDVAHILEVTSRKTRGRLLDTLIASLRARNVRLAILGDDVWRDQTRTYIDAGFDHLETIVFFERPLKAGVLAEIARPEGFAALEYEPAGLRHIDTLLKVDHASFPWLWWNSAAELEQYIQSQGVFANLALSRGEVVGYTSYTLYEGWAHLDRLAVVQGRQGGGLGAAQVAHTLALLVEAGSGSVGLSTQATNERSHRLYRRLGFQESTDKMRFYGLKLDPTLDVDFVERWETP